MQPVTGLPRKPAGKIPCHTCRALPTKPCNAVLSVSPFQTFRVQPAATLLHRFHSASPISLCFSNLTLLHRSHSVSPTSLCFTNLTLLHQSHSASPISPHCTLPLYYAAAMMMHPVMMAAAPVAATPWGGRASHRRCSRSLNLSFERRVLQTTQVEVSEPRQYVLLRVCVCVCVSGL